MDATAYNVSNRGLGSLPVLRKELELIHKRVLPGYGPLSCTDPEIDHIHLNAEVSLTQLMSRKIFLVSTSKS